jgi:hypothetical protein
MSDGQQRSAKQPRTETRIAPHAAGGRRGSTAPEWGSNRIPALENTGDSRKTSRIPPSPADVRPSPKPKVWTLSTPHFCPIPGAFRKAAALTRQARGSFALWRIVSGQRSQPPGLDRSAAEDAALEVGPMWRGAKPRLEFPKPECLGPLRLVWKLACLLANKIRG